MYNPTTSQHRIQIKQWLLFGLFAAAICGYIVSSERGSTTVFEGMTFTAHAIIPSVFPVMLIAELMTRSGVLDHISSFFYPLMNRAKLNPHLLAPVLVGYVCGFPAGAKSVRRSVENGLISNEEANCLLAASNCAGPAFVISAVGSGMYSSAMKGFLLWFVCSTTCTLLSFVLIPRQHDPKKDIPKRMSNERVGFSELFCESVKSTSLSILNLFCLITFFYSLSKSAVYALEQAGINSVYCSIASGLLEIGSGCASAAFLPDPYSICITAFSVGFGGMCVFFQVKNEAHRGARMTAYLTIKAVCGVISTLFACFLLQS